MSASLSPWLSASRSTWESAVSEWLSAAAKQNDLGAIHSCVTLKERPWSLVRRIHFDSGIFYFKACSESGQYEPALYQFLESQTVQHLPDLVAVDWANKWMLMADSGPSLHDTFALSDQVKLLGQALSNYAQLQIASTEWVDQLLDLGLPDRRLSRLPSLLESLLSSSTIGVGRSQEAVETLRRAAFDLLPTFEQICTDLEDAPVADAIDHGDFHTRNLLINENGQTLIDWGDSCITHPFCSLLVTLESVQDQLSADERQARIASLKDAYLEPWTARYPREALVQSLERALWIAHVGRALDFDHMFAGADEETLNHWRPLIFDRLARWVQCCPED